MLSHSYRYLLVREDDRANRGTARAADEREVERAVKVLIAAIPGNHGVHRDGDPLIEAAGLAGAERGWEQPLLVGAPCGW